MLLLLLLSNSEGVGWGWEFGGAHLLALRYMLVFQNQGEYISRMRELLSDERL